MPTATPLGNKIRVEVLPQSERSKVILTMDRETPLRRCRVEAIGPDVTQVRAGQVVLCNLLAGQRFGEQVILPQQSVVATLME